MMNADSWETSSTDVKQSIIARAAPPETRRLCQLDRQSREICRDRLPAEVKFRSCLDSSAAAKECDKIPMFSKQQFLQLIPPQIAVYPNDPLQFTHEFYSQKYKLPDEGFSQALRKAKIINTLCALIRPSFLVQYGKNLPPLPAYVDVDLVDRTISNYIKVRNDLKTKRASTLDINIRATSSSMPKTDATITIIDDLVKNSSSVRVMISMNKKEAAKLLQVDDPFISTKLKIVPVFNPQSESVTILYKMLAPNTIEPTTSIMSRIMSDFMNNEINAFLISRIIYDLLNKGFDTWTIFSVTL
jgi:hypothetical protein